MIEVCNNNNYNNIKNGNDDDDVDDDDDKKEHDKTPHVQHEAGKPEKNVPD